MLLGSVLPQHENVQRCDERTQQWCNIECHHKVLQTLNPKSMSIFQKGFVCKMTYRKKEKNKNQKMGKRLARNFSSLGFRLLISSIPSVA
jgi:hypothetical protein